MTPHATRLVVPAVLVLLGAASAQAEASAKKTPELQSIGPIAFGPEHLLLVSDPKAASIWAFDAGKLEGDGLDAKAEPIEDLGGKIAALLGTTAAEARIVDLAVDPATRQVFFSVLRGRGPDAAPVLLRAGRGGKLSEVALAEMTGSVARLTDAPPEAAGGEAGGRRRGGGRMESITDLAYVDGKVVVAGLSNEEFASKLRVLPYPFDGNALGGSGVRIYHGAHGRFETDSPVRTFVPFEVQGTTHIVAAYTCTPLVIFPLGDLAPGQPVTGKTIAELGNRNRPLDMVAYKKDDGSYLLIANNSRGVMKLATKGIGEVEKIETHVTGGGTAGVAYETIEDLKGVVQLDKLDEAHAVVLIAGEDGGMTLRVVKLP
jgi:hypothetical protein